MNATPNDSSELQDSPPSHEAANAPESIDPASVGSIEDVKTEVDIVESHSENEGESTNRDSDSSTAKPQRKRRRRRRRDDAKERRLLGRRNMCLSVHQIAPSMLKTVKMRILARHLDSKRGMDETELTDRLVKDSKSIVGKSAVLERVNTVDPDVHRRNLKDIIINVILLQEETYSLEERKLEERVLEYETQLVKNAKSLDFFNEKKHDQQRVRNYETYHIVLDAAWRNNDDVSLDEAKLLDVLRDRLDISSEEHRLLSAHLKRFPKAKCELHTREEIHDARKELQREGLLWSYRDENNRSIDVIPVEVADVLRSKAVAQMELQKTNYERLMQHDCITVADLREILIAHNMDRYGAKAELIERIANSHIQPSRVLSCLDRAKLSDMCRLVGLTSSGKKEDLIGRLVQFYDDLTFVPRESADEREEWYNNYELLANRAYADLRAKKLISKDLDIEHQFEQATDFLFDELLNLTIDNTRKVTKADGRILLDDRRVILWDCKSSESPVNLQDFLESQFDEYLRKEREKGFDPLALAVIGPAFTPNSIKLAHQYKARTNWDIALVHADALKHVAEHWLATDTEQPFPIGLFNRTELIDKDRSEFLISLA